EYTNLSEEFINQNKNILDPDGDGYVDVSGGFHDAGDHVKFGMPEAYAASTLGWGYYEFRDSYIQTGQNDHIETVLRYFNDYFMKCTFRNNSGNVVAFCYQVGEGEIDHSYWNAPEIDEMKRKGFFLTAEKPQTDYVVATAASLASAYLNFKDTDFEYANKCLDYAQALFEFAQTNEKQLSDNEDGPRSFYNSSKWVDDYCWAGMWLYMATDDTSYLDEALGVLNNDYYAPPTYVHCWNDVWTGAMCLISECNDKDNTILDRFRTISGKNEYEIKDFWSQIKKQIQNCMTGSLGTLSPQGYFFLDQWGSARYNTAAQLAALVYDKYNNNGKPSQYSDWARSQMEYLLGNNDSGTAYVVGYNENAVKYPHHRAASGLTMAEDTREQKHVLYGALVGGPDGDDNHSDTTNDWIYNEVTIDYNAAFVGACAGLYE
ncbi:MAG: glycoside hydrolase family 9 protein, partial [Oscillospiraceae bacterium]|nr:glycoside hydrolase family 9 protein [Oscillospiraceae bacterium]